MHALKLPMVDGGPERKGDSDAFYAQQFLLSCIYQLHTAM
jgi:hypothetical protein